MTPIGYNIGKVKKKKDKLVFPSHIEKGVIWQTQESISL